jgi:hypothetical protein
MNLFLSPKLCTGSSPPNEKSIPPSGEEILAEFIFSWSWEIE